MVAHGHRRQVSLFLVAVLLPCMVLVLLGLRIIEQERELGAKRLADERRSVAARLRQELSSHLARIALQEATALAADPDSLAYRTYLDPSVVLVGQVSDGHLVLPWERDPRRARFGRLLVQGTFGRLVAEGERTEMGSGRPGDAIRVYAQALGAANDPAQATYARMLRARASLAAGSREAARRDYGAVLRSDPDIVDEHGVPLALYAAARLGTGSVDGDVVMDRVQATLAGERWLSPTALYLLRDIVDTLRSNAASAHDDALAAVEATIAGRIGRAEQALALQRDLPHLGIPLGDVTSHNGQTPWITYGIPPWLVGRVAPVRGQGEILVAVRADSASAAVQASVLDGTGAVAEIGTGSGGEEGAESLGPDFPDLVARIASPSAAGGTTWDIQRWFYIVGLLFVLSVTLFGSYIVSRDVRRELNLAEMRSRFVSAVSHELKTPLTAIRMFAETLQLGGASDREMLTEYLETIVYESERLTRLLNNVLDFSKIERGRKEYRRVPNDLADIVSASARAIQYSLERQRFTLNVQTQDGLPPASVDADAMEQAILNLLSNAVKYSGGRREIDLRLTRSDGHAVIAVSDRGIGIAPEEQRKIFEQFYRVPSPDNDGVPGTGLGLTLVRHIAEGHRGRVTVDSAPGRGSTFAIHIPLESDES